MSKVAKLMRSVTAGVLLLLAPVSVAAISDIGRSEITRIWTGTEDGRRFSCSASYIFPYIDENRSWLLTAGHCAGATMVARNASATTWGVINWRSIISTHGENGTSVVDIALATVPDVRIGETKRLWLADKLPDRAEGYIHGYPDGVETVVRGIVAPPQAAERVTFMQPIPTPFGMTYERMSIAAAFHGTRFMIVPPGLRVGPGSSGSVILDGNDRVIAVLWGGLHNTEYKIEGLPERVKDWDIVLITPVDAIHELLKSIGVEK